MTAVAAERELYQACRVIFGSELTVSREFLEYLQISGVKSAFRKRVFEIHPDRLNGRSELVKKRSVLKFHTVTQAYEKLTVYVDARDNGFRFQGARPHAADGRGHSSFWGERQCKGKGRWTAKTASGSVFTQRTHHEDKRKYHARQARTAGKSFSAIRHHQGTIPERPLLFGRYLYYAGLVSWQILIQALIWQRNQKIRLGEAAVRLGWLTKEDVFAVLKACPISSLPFGQQAVLKGLLRRTQLILLLAQQKQQHKRLGSFFVEKKFFSHQQLAHLLVRFHRHNSRFGPAGRAGQK